MMCYTFSSCPERREYQFTTCYWNWWLSSFVRNLSRHGVATEPEHKEEFALFLILFNIKKYNSCSYSTDRGCKKDA